MKNAIDKAEQWLNDNLEVWNKEQLKSLILLMKEQDRDTRHACAEAVIQCDKDVSGECIWVDDAHSACINVKVI